VDMVAIDRARVDHHLVRSRRLAKQLATAGTHVAAEHRVAILRDPHEMVLAVPDRVLPRLYRSMPAFYDDPPACPGRLKAWDFLIPYRGL
jgi:hypothetical protein